ncbi:MAG: DNA-protecting protein DprA [Candidatus Poribacteria bacterium]|nr:DNA-protecting protein DprA [Candidatus Poribacteria bacterium]
MTSSEDTKDWIILNMIPSVGSSTFRRLVKFFGSPSAVLAASLRELSMVRGVTPSVCQNIIDHRDNIQVDRELDLINQHNCKLITITDENYPSSLKAIYDPPPILYVKGNLLPADSYAISVVGTRNATTYGIKVAEQLSSQLASKGITIVSGMAYGIDTFAHKGALNAKGRTIAVMGCGLDIIYPAENSSLFEKIVSSGAVISELPMGTKPHRGMFPRRNRIISGMSLGTLVVEASKRSGAMITVDCALEQGREVFAVPGQIFSDTSKGTNELIKQGAKLVDSVEDILNELPSYTFQSSENESLKNEDALIESQLSQEESAIWKVINSSPIHIDDISKRSALPIYKVSSTLVMLELKGLIQQLAGKMFVRKSSSL